MNDGLFIFNDRLIAFLDVLGFGNRMQNESTISLVQEYAKFIEDADKRVFSPPNILAKEHTLVSNFATSKFVFDSIVLVSHPLDDTTNICNFIMATIELMESGFINNLPLRGAISLGSYVEDTTNGIFISPEFKVLHAEEQRLQWAGCCILDNAADIIIKGTLGHAVPSEYNKRHLPLVYYPVPIKNEDGSTSYISRWALNWTYFLSSTRLEKVLDYLIEPKKSETAKFVKHLDSLPGQDRQLIQGHKPPIYFRHMPSIASCRIQFTDKFDIPTEPEQELTITFGEQS